MIKKLRRKFILVTMLSVFCVLAVIMTAINAVNYGKVASYADSVLDVLYEGGGKFQSSAQPMPGDGGIKPDEKPDDDDEIDDHDDDDDDDDERKPMPGMNRETPYETRYFTVKFGETGAVADVGSIAAVSGERAVKLAAQAAAKRADRGYIGIYRYYVADDGAFVLFVDCARQKDTADTFLITSLWISGAGLVAVFVLILFLSKLAVRPIAESYEKQKRFITDASHELKTPLTIISANNELAELTGGETQYTATISAQVDRMTAMVKNLTALARLDETEKLQQKTEFSLSDALSGTADSFRAAIEKGGRAFSVEVADDLATTGDETLMRQAFSIILENASKYALTKVKLSAVRAGKNIVVECENDADGIVLGDLNRCFERFYRSSEARASEIHGNGVGLSIAKSIVELHGGEVTAFGKDNGIFVIRMTLRSTK